MLDEENHNACDGNSGGSCSNGRTKASTDVRRQRSDFAHTSFTHMATHTDDQDEVELCFDDTEPLVAKSHGNCHTVKAGNRSMMDEGHKSGKNFPSPSLRSERPESESILSMRHLSEGGKAMRTTDPISSQFNMLNMYIGIAIIALPKAVSEVGFIGAMVGLLIVNCISLAASYFLLKARNRFKKQRIIDFPDIANACYGPSAKVFCETILIMANCSFAMAQGMYLGGQADLFAC